MPDTVEAPAGITIRDLTTYDECVQARAIQQACWQFAPGEGLHPPMLVIAARSGGTVLGAFDGTQMIAFLFGFLGLHEGHQLKLCSQTMAVLPDYRNRGVAAALKWAQRERMLALGIDLITWTYDPLEAANARLNLHTLGATARTYYRNLYGESLGALNRGLPSDRFLVEWWIRAPRGRERAAGQPVSTGGLEGPVLNPCQGEGSHRRIVSLQLDNLAPVVHAEIPASFQAMKRADMELATDWRAQMRELFETCFARGYQAVDVLKITQDNQRRVFYTLRTTSPARPA
jgi:predicted GNAT superfamily acetyltransferase